MHVQSGALQSVPGPQKNLSYIRVVIADDHALVREGLRRLLGTTGTMDVVGEATNGQEAIDAVRTLRPDVLLLDISMPRKDGIEATREITACGLGTKVLVLTMFSHPQFATRAMRAGAHGFIWKGAKLNELRGAIETVHSGEPYLPGELTHGIQARIDKLSKRECQVLQSLAQGMTNREIAEELSISVKTVDTHRGKVLKKLDLRNNSDLTRYAIRTGLLFP